MNFFNVIFVVYLLTLLAIPHLLWLRKRPASTVAWAWAIILFPFVGAFLYFLVGAERMKRKCIKRRRQFRIASQMPSWPTQQTKRVSYPDNKSQLLPLLSLINRIPVAHATDFSLLLNASRFYPALIQSIQTAKISVHIQFYIWNNDQSGREFLDTVVQAAKRGVKVRVLLDEMGCLGLSRNFFAPLIAHGGEFSWFNTLHPLRNRFFLNLRNHRKLQIIDTQIAYVGGMNLGDEYLGLDEKMGYWRDMQVELRGSVVTQLEELFADDWYFATEKKFSYLASPLPNPDTGEPIQILADGPDQNQDPLLKSFACLCHIAQSRLWIATGYFIPNELLSTSLQICAARGVDVRLLIAKKNDHPGIVIAGRSFYEELLSFGIRIFEYSIGMNHSKAAIIDHQWAMIGSANFNNRSLRLSFELNVLVESPAENQKLAAVLESDFNASEEILLDSFINRSFKEKCLEVCLRPLSPLF